MIGANADATAHTICGGATVFSVCPNLNNPGLLAPS